MDTIFLNSGNSKTSDPCKLLISHTKITNLKYKLRHGMKSLNYLMGHVLY